MTSLFRTLFPAAALLCASCIVKHDAGPVEYDSRTVESEGIASAHVVLRIGAGDLKVTDGASQLARANFAYNVREWKPEVQFTKSGDRGTLRIEQPKSGTARVGNTKYSWDVQLNNKIPMDLEVHFGAGQAKLDIGSLQLRGVEVHMGVGEADLDLRGPLQHSYNVVINGGVGQATVRVPSDAGVYAEAHGGIGSIKVTGMRQMGDHWETETYDSAANKLRVEAHGGIGEIRIIAN
jgi:hypothetical protein